MVVVLMWMRRGDAGAGARLRSRRVCRLGFGQQEGIFNREGGGGRWLVPQCMGGGLPAAEALSLSIRTWDSSSVMRRFASACSWKSVPQLGQHVDFVSWDRKVATGDIWIFFQVWAREKEERKRKRGVSMYVCMYVRRM